MNARSDKITAAEAKAIIIKKFNSNVRGKIPNLAGINTKHAGKEGHWLETQMGIDHNNKNEPDLLGYEMKNQTKGKTTFGDWSADYYIFKSTGNKKSKITKDDFLSVFGKKNLKKKDRFSWSGEPVPNIKTYNKFGQKLKIDRSNNILAVYSFEKDCRLDKKNIVPAAFQENEIILAKWNKESIKKKLEDKFNKFGWFKCLKNKENKYTEIVFGKTVNFELWIGLVKLGIVFFDSGMYQGNSRNYSQWRASNAFWDQLIFERY